MGKMKEAIMEVTEYILENQMEYFTVIEIENEPTFESAQEVVMAMDEETFFVTLMLATPTRKETHAV